MAVHWQDMANASAPTSVARLGIPRRRAPRATPPPMWRRRTAPWSTRCRSCSSSRCATAGPTSWSAGRPRRLGRHVGAGAGKPHELRGCHLRLRAGNRPHPLPAPPGRAAASPVPLAPVGLAVEAAPPGDLGAALVGRTMLYWWPEIASDGWQRGTVERLCP
jgi:hypothetical protein